jgi:hypothetical protein
MMVSYINLSCLILLNLANQITPASAPPDPALILEQFDVFNDGDLLIVPVQVGGKTYAFCIDTGCVQNVYDSSLRGILGDRLPDSLIDTPNGICNIQQYREPTATIGKLAFKTGNPVCVTDLGNLRAATGHKIYGLIGLDFLKQYTVRIDFDRGKLYFLREPGPQPGAAITMVNGPLGPGIDADLPIGKHRFVIDTGYRGHSGGLRKDAYDLLMALGHLHLVAEEKAQTVGAVTKHVCGSLDSLSIGSFRHRELVFNREENSYLGLSYLSRFNVIFDFPRSTLYVTKSQYYNSSDPVGLSGLHLLRRNGLDVVRAVDQNSPAEKSGIKPGDILFRLDGKPVSQQRIHSLWKCLRTPNPRLSITIRRNQEELTTIIAVTATGVAPR